jgi:hypothetical protein
MTTHDPRQGEEGPRHLVAQAERQLAFFGAMLDQAAEDLAAGSFDTPREAVAAVLSLRKALEAVFNERAKLEKLGEQHGGGGALDLDAARAEIGRRMARLRASVDPRELSGGPE